MQAPSDDYVRGANGNKFDSEAVLDEYQELSTINPPALLDLIPNRRAAFKRKYLTTDSALGASRMILINYRELLFTNEVTLVDPTDHMTMLTAHDPSDCEVVVSMTDLSKLLREIWSCYNPQGKQLSIDQIDEVCETFREWIYINGQSFIPQVDTRAFIRYDFCVRFKDFHQWFLQQCEIIDRYLEL